MANNKISTYQTHSMLRFVFCWSFFYFSHGVVILFSTNVLMSLWILSPLFLKINHLYEKILKNIYLASMSKR